MMNGFHPATTQIEASTQMTNVNSIGKFSTNVTFATAKTFLDSLLATSTMFSCFANDYELPVRCLVRYIILYLFNAQMNNKVHSTGLSDQRLPKKFQADCTSERSSGNLVGQQLRQVWLSVSKCLDLSCCC